MSDRVERTWTDDWETRVRRRVTDAGYRTPGEFLAAFPGEPFVEIVKRLGDDVAAVQLTRLRLLEASAAGDAAFRDAAKDALARTLNDRMPSGWKSGGGVHGAFAEWETYVRQFGGDEADEFAREVGNALIEARPVQGWRPSGPDDSLLTRLFDQHWPTVDGREGVRWVVPEEETRQEADEVLPEALAHVSDGNRELLARHEGGDVEYLAFLSESDIERVAGETKWLKPFRSGLLVFAFARNGDAWALDLDHGEAVVLVSHDLAWERQVEDLRDATIRVADTLADALRRARAGTLPIDYWEARRSAERSSS